MRLLTASIMAAAVGLASAISCGECVGIATIAMDIAGDNSTTLAQVISALDDACVLFDPNSTTVCEELANLTVSKLLPFVDKQLTTLAWPIPEGICSVFVPVCPQPCCSESFAPEQLHLSFTSDPSEMAITWVTLNISGDAAVTWGAGAPGAPLTQNAPAMSRTYTSGSWVGTLYTAIMTGLQAGTTYSYRVGSASAANGLSDVWSFSTLPADVGTASGRPLRFVQIGDMGYGNASNGTIASVASAVDAGEVDFVLHVGDVGYADGYMVSGMGTWMRAKRICSCVTYDASPSPFSFANITTRRSRPSVLQPHWDLFLNKIQPIAARVPYMVAPGCVDDHDHDCVGVNGSFCE